MFSQEKWVDAKDICLKHKGKGLHLPTKLNNIKIAESKLTGRKGEELVLAKEIRQAHLLAEKGDCVYLIPKRKDAKGKFIPGPDAIVNGFLFEFKTVTGSIRKVERHFRNSRDQCENVYLRIIDKELTKDIVVYKIHRILNDPTYTIGTNGWLILHMDSANETYWFNINLLK
jgi:hypothetical protein